MKVAVFSAKPYDREVLNKAVGALGAEGRGLELSYLQPSLDKSTAGLAKGCEAVCVFVNDKLDAATIEELASHGTQFIAVRATGTDNVDLKAAAAHRVKVVAVPGYSPSAVAEHALALLMCLCRKIHRSVARVREGNFSLEGLMGFELRGSTVGVLGTGKIGAAFARIMLGMGCRVLAYDVVQNAELAAAGIQYRELEDLLPECDVISLHLPLLPATERLLNAARLALMKPSALLINTSRGKIVDTAAVVEALHRHRLGGAGFDVFEHEEGLFFENRSGEELSDDLLTNLLGCNNAIVTGHQGFFTDRALAAIADTTVRSLLELRAGREPATLVRE